MPRRGLVGVSVAAAMGLASACGAQQARNAVSASTSGVADPYSVAERVGRWQLSHLPPPPPVAAAASGQAAVDPELRAFVAAENPGNPTSWHQAVFWLGMTKIADGKQGSWATDAVIRHGRSTSFALGQRLYNADDQLTGQSYLWAARAGLGSEALRPMRAAFDKILANPPRVHLSLHLGADGMRGYPKAACLARWCWADALFMAPATWIDLSNVTRDGRYRDYAIAEFNATRSFLYDPAERLYFRDSRFFDLRDDNGQKVFWSRGNGWVFAGLARMIEALPARDPKRPNLVGHFRELARRIAKLQRADGFWSSNLLDTKDVAPESSGTALFTYAFAWGVTHKVLPRGEFEPVVRKAWRALGTTLQPDGSLGWVQPAGDRPGRATAASTQIYANGALILAATAVGNMNKDK